MSSNILMHRRRIMMGEGNKSILPDGYTQLTYIENPSNAYFNSGVAIGPTSSFSMETNIIITSTGTNQYMGNSDLRFGIGYNSGWMWASTNGEVELVPLPIVGTQYLISLTYEEGVGTLTANGNSFTKSRTFSDTNDFGIFATYGGFYAIKAKMGETKMYLDGVLVRHFIPCRNPNNICGMYDVANATFYSSARSGVEFLGE